MSRKKARSAAKGSIIVLDARLSIARSAELHGELRARLEEGAPILIDGSQVEEIDTAILQLLASLWRTCAERGVECKWRGPSDALRRAAALIGIEPMLGMGTAGPAAGQLGA